MTRRRAPASLALEPTPARERLVAIVAAALAEVRATGAEPRAVYLTADDAAAVGLKIHFDPPRVLGIEIRPVRGKGNSRLYTKNGVGKALSGIREKVK